MWPRLRTFKPLAVHGARSVIEPGKLGPMFYLQSGVKEEIEAIAPLDKHWACRGHRSVALASAMLREKELLAIPSEIGYNFVSNADDNRTLRRLYEISEGRSACLCLGSVKHIRNWVHLSHRHHQLIMDMLPGPLTLLLPRKAALNPAFNPDSMVVPVRVPKSKFLRGVATLTHPLAIVDARIGDDKPITEARQFADLWPRLDRIFYDYADYAQRITNKDTVLDLSNPGKYRIVRHNVPLGGLKRYLATLGLRPDS